MKILKRTETTVTYQLTKDELEGFLLKHAFIKSTKPYTLYFYEDKEKAVTIYSTLKVVYAYKTKIVNEEQETLNDKIILGTDEVGTGDVFGGIMFGLMKIYPKDYEKLKSLKLTDSKKLNDETIKKIGKILEEDFFVRSLYISPTKYNSLHDSFNLNELKALSHNKLIHDYGSDAEEIIVDAFCSLDNYKKYLNGNQSFPEKTHWLTKAETKSIAVAGASIYARYAWLKEFEKLEHEFNLKLPKGSGALVDSEITKLRETGFKDFSKISKLHFKNFKK